MGKDLDYWSIPALSHELKERLSNTRPATFGAAQRVEGATPGGLLALYAHLKGNKRRSPSAARADPLLLEDSDNMSVPRAGIRPNTSA